MLRLDIATLQPGNQQFDFQPMATDVDLDPLVFADIQVEVRLDAQQDRIVAILTANARATLVCDRTLRAFEQPVEGAYSLLFASPETGVLKGEAEHVRVLHPTDRYLDLTEAVRDTLLLALPARRVAPGAEDADLQVQFGEDDDAGVDPRWEALRQLRPDDSTG